MLAAAGFALTAERMERAHGGPLFCARLTIGASLDAYPCALVEDNCIDFRYPQCIPCAPKPLYLRRSAAYVASTGQNLKSMQLSSRTAQVNRAGPSRVTETPSCAGRLRRRSHLWKAN